MKKKIFSILLTLVLVLSFSLVTAAPVMAATLTVDISIPTSGTNFHTIQAAVTAATPGDTINVAAGTYPESVTINKSLTLLGAEAGVDARTRTFTGESILDGTSLPVGESGFFIAGGVSGVVIDGFEIRNYASPSLGGGSGNAISAWQPVGTSNIQVLNNYMHDLGWNAVLVGNEGQSLHDNWLVENNVVENSGGYGIELTNTQNSSVIGNEITGGLDILGVGGWGSLTAITVMTQIHRGLGLTSTSVTVEDNIINGPQEISGIYVNAWDSTNLLTAALDNVTVSNNYVGETERGIIVFSDGNNANISNLSINGNVLDGNVDSLVVLILADGMLSVTITENDIINSTSSGIYIWPGTSVAGIAVNYNNITGNALYGINNEGTGILDATNNWWGDVSGPNHPSSWIYNSNTITNPSGLGDQVTDYVLYDPWLVPQVVGIDIKPGSDPNSINLKSKGVIPVAILGSATFDVTDVDVETLEFAGATPVHDLTIPVVYAAHLQDVNDDGFTDLVCHFRTQETGITKGDTEATLNGATNIGVPIAGTDSIRTVGKP